MHSGDRFLYGFKPGRLGPDVPPLHPAMRSLPLRGGQPDRSLSGQTTRHRLNRGGDRALNKAIHIIANTRMRSDPSTQAYMLCRRAEGKSDREIRRCIKRYIARQLYRNAAKLEARLGRWHTVWRRHELLGVSTVENHRKCTALDIVIAWRRTHRLLDPNPGD